MPFPISD